MIALSALGAKQFARPDLPMPEYYVDDRGRRDRRRARADPQRHPPGTGAEDRRPVHHPHRRFDRRPAHRAILDRAAGPMEARPEGQGQRLSVHAGREGPSLPLRHRLRARRRHHGPVRRPGRARGAGAVRQEGPVQPGHLRGEPPNHPADRRLLQGDVDGHADASAPGRQLRPAVCEAAARGRAAAAPAAASC